MTKPLRPGQKDPSLSRASWEMPISRSKHPEGINQVDPNPPGTGGNQEVTYDEYGNPEILMQLGSGSGAMGNPSWGQGMGHTAADGTSVASGGLRRQIHTLKTLSGEAKKGAI